jgi:Lrp/AsnC family transcriptional regulator, regulator for asnA, asnC and gidA
MQSLIQVAVDQNKLNQVVEELMNMYEVRLIVLTSGENQLMIQVFTRDTNRIK